MELVAVAAAVAVGLEFRKMMLLAGAVFAPLAMLGGLAVLYWRQRTIAESRAAMFCEGVASELRSGSPLGHALAAAAAPVEEAALDALTPGTPQTEAAHMVGEAFPEVGPELESTITAAFRSGSKSADLFDEIGSLAIAQAEVSREVRVASAPARATALIFIAAPTIYLVLQARSGGLARLLAHPEQRLVSMIGLGLFGAGLLAAGLLAWRAR